MTAAPLRYDLLVPADRDEAVRMAERGDRSRSLAQRIRDQVGRSGSDRRRRFHQTDQQILGPPDFGADFHRHARRGGLVLRCWTPTQNADHRRNEFVERKDRRRREAGQNNDRSALMGGQANGLARLQSDAMSDDAGTRQLVDDPVRKIALSLARSAGKEHDIGLVECRGDPLTKPLCIVGRDT